MEILDIAITHEGGVHKLARSLGIKPNVISNWRHPDKQVPRGWHAFLVTKYGHLVPVRKAKKAAST